MKYGWKESEETADQTVAPDVLHVHSLRVPDVRLEPDLVHCGTVSLSFLSDYVEMGNAPCRRSSNSFLEYLARMRSFCPIILRVFFSGTAAPSGVCSRR